ncbi:MAG: enolase [Candidatus Aenigmatarchaeota archaeon]
MRIREILATDSHKTIEVEIDTSKGTVRSSVPIGTSKGKHEAKYLPTSEVLNKFLYMKRHFTNSDFDNQEDVDSLLRIIDKTEDFRQIGGNLAIGISSAFLKAFAQEADMEVFQYLSTLRKTKPAMPRPICNIIGGGKHAGRIDIQEFHFLPVHQRTFTESIMKIANAYRTEGKRLKENDPTFAFTKNVEAAWTSNLIFEEILNLMTKVANEHLLKMGLDFAASSLWDGKQYYVYRYANDMLNTSDQIAMVKELMRNYPVIYVEDPFHEEDFESFSVLSHEVTGRLVCGDDLYSTNLKRLQIGKSFASTNSVIVKPNQVGTITDTIKFVDEAKKSKMITIMSHRSSDTEDTLISHMAVGLGCDYIKLGISGDRTAKINELIRIEEKILKSPRENLFSGIGIRQ